MSIQAMYTATTGMTAMSDSIDITEAELIDVT